MNPAYTAVLPVKPFNLAKSRLQLATDDSAALARAFAIDTLDTLASCPFVARIVVVSAEVGIAQFVRRLPSAVLLVDRPMLAKDMLNPAIALARYWAMAHAPEAPIVVVPSDLAAMTPASLQAALVRLSDHDQAHVVDGDGVGTTLLAASAPEQLRACYGRDSSHRHTMAGSVAVDDLDPRVRRDVDRPEHLAEARRLGLAPHAALVVERLARLASSDDLHVPHRAKQETTTS